MFRPARAREGKPMGNYESRRYRRAVEGLIGSVGLAALALVLEFMPHQQTPNQSLGRITVSTCADPKGCSSIAPESHSPIPKPSSTLAPTPQPTIEPTLPSEPSPLPTRSTSIPTPTGSPSLPSTSRLSSTPEQAPSPAEPDPPPPSTSLPRAQLAPSQNLALPPHPRFVSQQLTGEVVDLGVFKTTCYDDTTPTAAGDNPGPHPQAISADPRVPFGVHLVIPGWGEGVTRDTGGVIKNRLLDAWLPSEELCALWGSQLKDVSCLENDVGTCHVLQALYSKIP